MKGVVSLTLELFLDYCHSKNLRPKTMLSYEQTLKLFARWMAEEKSVKDVEKVKESHIRDYIVDLQKRGKSACSTTPPPDLRYFIISSRVWASGTMLRA